MATDKDKDLFIGRQEFVVGYSKVPEQPQSSARPNMSFSRYDEHGARTSHHMHRCIGARRAAHYAHYATGGRITFYINKAIS